MSITVTPGNSRESGFSGRIVRVALVVVALSVVLGLSFVFFWPKVDVTQPRLASKGDIEALILERISLHEQLSTLLTRVADVATAKETSAQARRKLMQIASNLRKIRGAKGSVADTVALKKQYQAAQDQASKQLADQLIRIGGNEDAWRALNVFAALKKLDREEQSIPAGPAAPPDANRG